MKLMACLFLSLMLQVHSLSLQKPSDASGGYESDYQGMTASQWEALTKKWDLESHGEENWSGVPVPVPSAPQPSRVTFAGIAKKARALFSTECVMSIDTNQNKFHLLISEGGKQTTMMATKEGFFDSNGKLIGDAPAKPYICRVNNTNAKAGSMAVFSQTTGAKYLFGNSEGQWDSFLNQHCWAKKHNKHQFFWIGSVTSEARALLDAKPADAVPCKDGQPSNHYFRALGLKAILDENHNVGWIMQMDLDAHFSPAHFEGDFEQQFLANSGADIVGGSPSYAVFLNAAILAFKNSQFGRQLLSDWFKNRCGFKDQLSLWNSLFQAYKKEDPSFSWDVNAMSSYNGARKYTLQALKHFPTPSTGPTYPHTMIWGKGQDSFRMGKNSWTCHAKTGKASKLCSGYKPCDQDSCKC